MWNAGDHVLTEIHADGDTVEHRYDAFGDETRTQDAENFVTLSDYDRGTSTADNIYDPAGRLLWQRTVDETKARNDALRVRDTAFSHGIDTTEQVLTGHDESGVPTYQTVTRTDSSTGYDPAGNLIYSRSVQVIPDEGTIVTDTVTGLERAEGYRQAFQHTFSRNANSGNHQEARVSQYYDADGFLASINDSSSAQGNRQIYTDANGVVLLNVQNGTYLRQLVVNGEVLGVYGAGVDPHNPSAGNGNLNFVSQADFNLGYKPVTASYPEASTVQYTVRGGDTLRSIAQAAYGDADLWYQIALANGLEGDSDLRIGASLTIPTQIAGTHNSAGTFSPYDPSRVVGSTSPVNLPIPLGNHPSGGGGCGGVGRIITVVVAVVATVYLGPIAGNLIGQVVGNITGVQHGISWNSVAIADITAGIGAQFTQGAGAVINTGSTAADAFIAQAATNTIAQGISVALGLQKDFSWMQVAASAAGAAVGAGVNSALHYNASTSFDWIKSSLSATAASATTAVMHGGRVSITQVAVDAFGNVLGSRLAATASSGSDMSPYSLASASDASGQGMGLMPGAGGLGLGDVNSGVAGSGTGLNGSDVQDDLYVARNGLGIVSNVQISTAGDDASAAINDGRSMFAEVRSAISTPVAMGSAVGTPLPSSPYHWVSASIGSDGQTVAAHWSDDGSNPAFLAGMIPTSGYPAAPPPTPRLTGVLGAAADWLDYSEPGKALQGIMPGESFVAGGAKATMLFLAGHIGVGDVGKAAQVADNLLRIGNSEKIGAFYNVSSEGLRGEVPLMLEQRAQIQSYLSKFNMDDVTVRWVDDRNLNTAYGNIFGERILNIGSDVVPGNLAVGTLTANSRVSINATLAHELVGHMEAGMAGYTQDLLYLEEAQASIRAARFGPDLTSTERFTLLRDAITRLQSVPGGPVKIRDVKASLYIQHR
ncbi:LysM peptidoglycan-binding domain-containing protein [Xylophilus rhododendri]|uniref:LysM peptidoglycan-binding domain-containing protein n=1 Tax=Xylophilus rhododendri TaxID=2697032 RepID=A0A857J8Q9_9BURK|nr:LysM domain-containing protein [Xylophilus rhododendri]QHI99148.1 LysM peptidoglycan-binding domain-containing protein [Xylophilus rhododendri]